MTTIRNLLPQDYDRIIRLWDAAGLSYRPLGRDARRRMIAEMEGASAIFLGAEMDGELVGVVLGTHDGRKGWINRLAVHPEVRRRGVARRLVRALEERLRAEGIEIITALVEAWNANSMAFFRETGYVEHPEMIYFSKRSRPDV